MWWDIIATVAALGLLAFAIFIRQISRYMRW